MHKVLAMIAVAVFAGTGYAATAAVIWKDITPGARPNGMGEVFVAVSDDATASYWNPAGLAFFSPDKVELTLQHSKWLPQLADDLYFEFLGYAQHLEGWGGIGGNITFMSMGEQQEIPEGHTEPVGTFYSYGISGTGSFGTEVAPGLGVGMSLKFIYDHLYYEDSGKGSSFAADFGVLYHVGNFGIGDMSLGACLANLGPNMSYGGSSENNPLPREIRLGLAFRPVSNELFKVLAAADFSKLLVDIQDDIGTEIMENNWGAGAEVWYYDLLALRAGYSHDTEGASTREGLTWGAGIQWEGFQFDMAFIPVVEELQGSGKYNQKFSLTVRF